ncbi:hypothetical protein MLD38_018498 [Melastoma candidum]|uniref:Uncharacterized protein n=1 Tax=Melastoma candidum TaxID=119954 RepID=A0ACB9R2A2_9MYRT|nr:hypothetical protein MLD38_018498 [Melastoma candidum]
MAAIGRPANTSSKTEWSCQKHASPRVIVLGLVRCFENSASAVKQKLLSRNYFPMGKRTPEKFHRHTKWYIQSSSVDGRSGDPTSTNSTSSSTRLISFIQGILTNLSAKIRGLRRNLPVKLLFFLVGFYCATAFATVIGQTGDWDILSAALAVLVVEGIGALTYKASLNLLERARGLITMFNYWKAGLSLGLFLDSFKYDIGESLTGLYSIINLEVDIFPPFW